MDIAYNIRKYYKFDNNEIKALLITVFVISFLLSFKSWGTTAFNVKEGLINLISAFLIVLLGMLAHVSLQRIYAYKLGYLVKYQNFLYGILGGLVLCFASNGNLYFLAPGHVTIKHMPRLRLGEFRYGLNLWEYSKIAFAGPLASIVLAMFFKAFAFLGNPLIEKAVFINVVIALFSMVPLPNTDGLDVFYGSRIFYVFGLGLIIGIAISLFLLQGIWLAIALGLFLAIIMLLVYFMLVEGGFG